MTSKIQYKIQDDTEEVSMEPGELYEQNIALRKEVDVWRNGKRNADSRASRCCPRFRKIKWTAIALTVLLVSIFLLMTVQIIRTKPPYVDLSRIASPFDKTIGWRSDPLMQDCQSASLKKSFPDLDYGLLGYNILNGYPLAVGHDPGFTHPIFQADYSGSRQTADCRYSLPEGFVIIPDVSCVTSFSSDEVKTSSEFSRSLSTEAHVSGGGWGVSFSASAGYKEASSVISSGQTVYVISQASCNYYYMTLNQVKLPPFDKDFLKSAKQLVGHDADSDKVYDFIQYYGTHFAEEMTFGAKYIYQHKMTINAFQELSSKEISVSAQASYSGSFSVGGGFEMSASQRSAASTFSSKVETTTITVGAPPPSNGDAMTWASTVKETPVPTKYKLTGIEELFTDKHMGHADFDNHAVGRTLEEAINEGRYCQKLLNDGIVDSCKSQSGWIEFDNLEGLPPRMYSQRRALEGSCIEQCLKDKECIGVWFCKTCAKPLDNCKFMRGESLTLPARSLDWIQLFNSKVVILTPKMRHMNQPSFSLKNAWITSGGERDTSTKVDNEQNCIDACQEDINCNVYNFCTSSEEWCSSGANNCLIYNKDALQPEHVKLEHKEDATLKILSRK